MVKLAANKQFLVRGPPCWSALDDPDKRSTGAKILVPDESLLDDTADKAEARNERNNDGNWKTLVRLAEKLDPFYRQ